MRPHSLIATLAITTGLTAVAPIGAVTADELVHLALDEFGNTTSVVVGDPRAEAAARLLQFMSNQQRDPDDTGAGAIGASIGAAPPCKKDDAFDAPDSIAELKQANAAVVDGLSSSSNPLTAPPTGVADARNRSIWANTRRLIVDMYVDALGAEGFDQDVVNKGLAELLSWHGMSGLDAAWMGQGVDTVDSLVDTWYRIYHGFENDTDHYHDGAFSDLGAFLDDLAGQLEGAAAANRQRAALLDQTASITEANWFASDEAKAEAKRQREEAKALREKAEEQERQAAEARKRADEERKKAEQKQQSGGQLVDPDQQAPSITDVDSMLDEFPWLADTPWDPTRRLVLALEWGESGANPTNSRPGVDDTPDVDVPLPAAGPPGSLILVLEPGVSSVNEPCLMLDVVIATDPSIIPPELARPSGEEPVDGPLPDGPPTGPDL